MSTELSPDSPPSAWRNVLARWPNDRRLAWGEFANAYEEEGLSWKEAECRAFNDVMNGRKRVKPPKVAPAVVAAPESPPPPPVEPPAPETPSPEPPAPCKPEVILPPWMTKTKPVAKPKAAKPAVDPVPPPAPEAPPKPQPVVSNAYQNSLPKTKGRGRSKKKPPAPTPLFGSDA